MPNYRLINPLIIGEMNTTFAANSASDAAEMAWTSLTKHVVHNVPKMAFTMSDQTTGNLHHFLVKEKTKGNNKMAELSISPLTVKLSRDQEKKFSSRVNTVMNKLEGQFGGNKDDKKKNEDDSDSSDSSSTEELYEKVNRFKKSYGQQPIVYWWYNPTVYGYGDIVESIFVPTFVPSLMPYVEVNISSAFF